MAGELRFKGLGILCLFFFCFCFSYLFIYVAMPGLSCSTQGLWLWHPGIWFPEQGWNLGPLHGVLSVLATEPPGKCLRYFEVVTWWIYIGKMRNYKIPSWGLWLQFTWHLVEQRSITCNFRVHTSQTYSHITQEDLKRFFFPINI